MEEPFIYILGKEFDVLTNILRAELDESGGWMVLELEGTAPSVERAVGYIASRGIEVTEGEAGGEAGAGGAPEGDGLGDDSRDR